MLECDLRHIFAAKCRTQYRIFALIYNPCLCDLRHIFALYCRTINKIATKELTNTDKMFTFALRPREAEHTHLYHAIAESEAKENTMAKYKHTNGALAITSPRSGTFGLIGASRAALNEVAATVVAKQTGNGHTRSLQAVSTGGQFSAIIRHENTVLQFEGNHFAVSTHD